MKIVPLLGVRPSLFPHIVESGLGKVEPSYWYPHGLIPSEGQPDRKEFLAGPVSLTLLHLQHSNLHQRCYWSSSGLPAQRHTRRLTVKILQYIVPMDIDILLFACSSISFFLCTVKSTNVTRFLAGSGSVYRHTKRNFLALINNESGYNPDWSSCEIIYE
jgi:hypothetical protein